MRLTLPQITSIIFENIRDTCFRLKHASASHYEAKKMATLIYQAVKGNTGNESIETFKSDFFYYTEMEQPLERKTKVIRLNTVTDGHLMGEIRWGKGSVRSYCFYPASECYFNQSALAEIQEFIGLLTNERNMVRQKIEIK